VSAGVIDPDEVAAAIGVLGDDAHVEVNAERAELLRFGGSRITYQHQEERIRVRARLVRDDRAAWATTESLSPQSITALRRRLEQTLSALPPAKQPALAAVGDEPTPRRTWHEHDPAAGVAQRLAWFDEVRGDLGANTEVGGSAQHVITEHVVAGQSGPVRTERRSKATLQVVGTRGAANSYAKAVRRDPAAIDPHAVAVQVERGLVPEGRVDLAPGDYPVLFGPAAAATLLGTFGHLAFGARDYDAGHSPMSGRLGQPVAAPLLDIVDDATDSAGLPTGFDPEGVAKRPTSLIAAGEFRGVVHDRASAAAAVVASTGHAVPPAWRFGAGPAPSHLVVGSGALGTDDLLGALGRGLVVQRVDYVRVVRPRESVVTGTTRDATLWVDGGRVVARAPQFRFTVRLTDLLARITALGAHREASELVFMESVVTPALLVSAFEVQSVIGA
jgi:predicted Zn-dependent protease